MPELLLALVAPELTDDVGRCAAAAGYRSVSADPGGCRRLWGEADAIVVDDSSASVLAAAGLPRRPGVIVVDGGDATSEIWHHAVSLGAEHAFRLPDDERRLVQALSRIRTPLRPHGSTVAVIGGHGGAGATTMAAAMGLVAAEADTGALVVDVDDLGAGVDLTLGVEDVTGLRWPDLTLRGGQVVAEALHEALPRVDDGLLVLSAGRPERRRELDIDGVLAAIEAGRVGGDLVVVDLPRRADALVRAVVETVNLVVVVTVAAVGAVAATRAVAHGVIGHGARAGIVVRGPAPGGLRAAQVADAVDLPILAAMRPEPRLAGRVEARGLRLGPRSPLRRAAGAVLADLDPAPRRPILRRARGAA
ncbi:septum site-determining protein Ssd [Williamsia sterculiae]|uniref:septum site-determining protein Ssd n=1 Tax=Williamsia sterculiae TaxID=1344003 RepID=UPI000970C75A|nr:septum site-determining protein Ssd [Williamsia sterculiae]